MQIKDQWKRPRDWKVITGAGAVAALGITGLVLANPADGSVPASITLEERAQIAENTDPEPLPLNGVVDLTDLADDLDSPFDDGPGNGVTGGDGSPDTSPTPGPGGADDDSPDTSPASPASPDVDSPDDSPAPGPGGGDDDSPDTSPASPASPDVDSPDDSPAASPASPDNDSPDDDTADGSPDR